MRLQTESASPADCLTDPNILSTQPNFSRHLHPSRVCKILKVTCSSLHLESDRFLDRLFDHLRYHLESQALQNWVLEDGSVYQQAGKLEPSNGIDHLPLVGSDSRSLQSCCSPIGFGLCSLLYFVPKGASLSLLLFLVLKAKITRWSRSQF